MVLPLINVPVFDKTSVVGGDEIVNARVVLEQAVPFTVNVELRSEDDSVASPVPSTVSIAPNTSTRAFQITTSFVEFLTTVAIRVFYGGVESLVEGESLRTRGLRVRPPDDKLALEPKARALEEGPTGPIGPVEFSERSGPTGSGNPGAGDATGGAFIRAEDRPTLDPPPPNQPDQ